MLAAFNSRLSSRVDLLVAEALSINLDNPMTVSERRNAEHIAFDLQLVWDRYVRNVILNSAIGRMRDSNGPVPRSVPKKITSAAAAAHFLVSLYPKRSDEPDWYLPNDAVQAAQKLSLQNFAKISGALGSTPWVLDELRHTRNFFAHRSRKSALKLKSESWYPDRQYISPVTTMFEFESGGIRKIEYWGQFMKLISQAID